MSNKEKYYHIPQIIQYIHMKVEGTHLSSEGHTGSKEPFSKGAAMQGQIVPLYKANFKRNKQKKNELVGRQVGLGFRMASKHETEIMVEIMSGGE
jgi:hypothetical protein